MTNDDGRKPEGAPERSLKAGVPSGVDGNGPKRFSVQRKMAIVARLLRGEPLELVARETNVLIASSASGASVRSQAPLHPGAVRYRIASSVCRTPDSEREGWPGGTARVV